MNYSLVTEHHADVFSHYTKDGMLSVAGRSIQDWWKMAHCKPFYLYCGDAIQKQIYKLRECLPSELEVHYAVKANPYPQLINYIAPLVDGLDVASRKELHLALNSNHKPESISITGPVKSNELLTLAIVSGAVIIAESVDQIIQANRIAKQLDKQAKVQLRINPHTTVQGMGVHMSGQETVFGMSLEQVQDALENWLQWPHTEFWGLHLYAGSQNLNAVHLAENFQNCLNAFIEVAPLLPCPPKILNFGGGLGIVYAEQDTPLDIIQYGKMLNPIIVQAKTCFPQARLCLELGRYLVGGAGVYVSQVFELKKIRGQNFVTTDGGLHHFQLATGLYNLSAQSNFPIAIIHQHASRKTTQKAMITGPLCMPLDILARDVSLPEVEKGDLIVIFQAGAYGRSTSPIDFLSHTAPDEFLAISHVV